MSDTPARAKNEIIKENSHMLRGGIADGLSDMSTGALAEDDTVLLKFHGSYMQDDRDVRAERSKKKLEKAFTFMIRLRIPGGLVSPKQWIALDDIASIYANGTLRMTTRETFQYHGIIKSNLRTTMQAIDKACLDTLAACGDVNRNVMSTANPYLSKVHRAAYDLARDLSVHLLPRTGAYHEIWLDGEKTGEKTGEKVVEKAGEKAVEQAAPVKPAKDDVEPIYGPLYLPRKFKAVVAVPPDNDVDIYAHDLGYIAIVEHGDLVGYNVTVGGGMGMTHGERDTFPRTADPLGFCTPEHAIKVGETVMTVQRDWGNRAVRKHARLKYTIETHGIAAFRAEVEKRLGFALAPPRPFTFARTSDTIGWHQTPDKKWHLTLFVEAGRLKDRPGVTARSAIREIAEADLCQFVVSANQNLMLAAIAPKAKAKIEAILKAHGVSTAVPSGLRRNAMSCVALPTCGLALAEAERYLPTLVTALEDKLDEAGLANDDIVIRMTGCPNGCARPYLAEIGLVGRGPGLYNLYLGAAFDGSRLNKLVAQDVGHDKIIALLSPLFVRYATDRAPGERFGDFTIRIGAVKATTGGNQFHADIQLAG